MVEYSYEESLSIAEETAVKYGVNKIWSFDDYIAAEELSEEKHEFHNGKRVAMAGGTPPHSEISNNFGTMLNIAFFNRTDDNFHIYNSDMKIFMPKMLKSVYPDLSFVEGMPLMKNKVTILNPLLIVEVLSDSTEAYDRGDKFEYYKTLSSFREYVLVSQSKPLVDVFYLENPLGNVWKSVRIEGLEAVIYLQSIDCKYVDKISCYYFITFTHKTKFYG